MPLPADDLPRTPLPANAEALELAPHGASDQPGPVIAGAILVGTVALMILGVQPVILEALAHSGRITEAQAGPLATLEVLALAFGASIGPGLMRRGGMRAKVALLSLLLAAANIGVLFAGSLQALFAARGVAGLLQGLMLASTLVVLIQHSKPDRMNALFLGLSTAPQAVLAYALPVWVTPTCGVNGGFVSLAVLALVGAAAALLLVDRVEAPLPAAPQRTGAWNVLTLGALAAVALQNAAIGAAWSYLPLLFGHRGFPATATGLAIAGGLVLQVVGAFLVAAWGGRLNHRLAVVLGSFLQAAIIVGLAMASMPAASIGLALAFGVFWLAVQPFQVRLLIEFDASRTAAMVLAATTLVGLSLGPALAALAVEGTEVTGAFWAATGLMLGAGCIYALLAAIARPAASRGEAASGG